MRYFCASSYRPERARLTIVGDLDTDKARRLVEKHFSDIRPPKASPLVRASLAEVTRPFSSRVEVQRRTRTATASLGFLIPKLGEPARMASRVAGEILGKAFREEFEDRGLVERSSSELFVSEAFASKTFAFRIGRIEDEKEVRLLEASLGRVLGVAFERITEESVGAQKRRLVGGFLSLRSDPFFRERMGVHFETESRELASLSLENVRAAFGSFFRLDRSVWATTVEGGFDNPIVDYSP